MSRPTEYGVRFTPAMARSVARMLTRFNFMQRYELDEAYADEVTELIARRLMETAHALDGPGQEFVERFMEEMLRQESQGGGGGGFIPPEFTREFAERLKSILPEVRKLAANVTQDVRPKLAFKQQLKLAGEMMAFNTAIDGFEQTLDQWARGEADKFGPSLDGPQQNLQKDETGQTAALRQAARRRRLLLDAEIRRADPIRRAGQSLLRVRRRPGRHGRFRPSRAARAGSVSRSRRDLARPRLSQPRLVTACLEPAPMEAPAAHQLERDYEELLPARPLEDELKRRIDRIPTESHAWLRPRASTLCWRQRGPDSKRGRSARYAF
jgi:hypothetical protein